VVAPTREAVIGEAINLNINTGSALRRCGRFAELAEAIRELSAQHSQAEIIGVRLCAAHIDKLPRHTESLSK
jgi:hypothetical protein